MPIEAELPDGRILEFPDGTNPTVIQATVKKVLGVLPETTVLGQVGEAFKGLVPGAVGLVESAATGASALLPEQYEKAAREKIASVAGAVKAPFAAAPGYEETVGRKLGEAIGSTAPFLLAGPLGLAGRIGAVGLGVGAGAGEARTRAEKEGATAEQRSTATALGIIPGAMEVFAPFKILARVPEAATAQGVQLVKRAFVAGGEEAAQEAASGFAQNLIAKGIYKPEQELIEGLGEQAAYGGATGAIVQGLMDLALGRRARGAQPAPGTLPGETPIERAERLAAEKAAQQPAAPPVPAPAPAPGEIPAPPPVAGAPAPEPSAIPEPKVRKMGEPIPLPDVLDSDTVKRIGFPRGKVHDALVGKSITDPEIRTVLEEYLNRPTANTKTAEKINAFLARLPEPVAPEVATPAPPPVVETAAPAVPPAEPAVETPVGGAPTVETTPTTPPVSETPSVTTTPTEPEAGGAGAPVAGEPDTGTAPEGAGAIEPTGVVPPVADAGQPAGREEAKPPAVAEPAAAEPAKPAPAEIVRGEYEPPVKAGLKPEREQQLREKLAQQRKELAVLEAARDKAEGNIYLAEITGNEEAKARAIDAHEAARLVLKKATAAADRTYAQLFDMEQADFEGSVGEAYVAELRAEQQAKAEAARAPELTGSYPYNLKTAEAVQEELRDQASHLPGYKELIEKYFTPSRQLRKGKTEEEFVREGQKFLAGNVLYRTIPQSPVVTNRVSHAELEKVVVEIEKALGGKVDVTILDDVTDVDAKQKPGSRAGATIKGGIYLFRSGIAKGIEGQKTIFHELFHKGLKNLLSEAEYRAMMDKFYSQSAEIRAMADAYLASDVGKGDTKNLSPQDARVLAVEESLAEVAEQTDLKPTMVRQVGNFLARVADRLGMPQLARVIRTMGLNEQEKFIRDALQAGMGPSKPGEGAARFRVGEGEAIKPIGQLGPIKNASIFYWSNETGVALQLFDQDLIDSGVKPSRAVVDQFDLDISKDGKTAEIHTHGVPPGSSAVLSKYKDQIDRVKPVGFSGDPYYKFDPGAFSNKEIRQLIRSLRDIAVQEGSFDKVETVRIKRATGATAGRAPREISREAAMRFRSITPQTEAAVEGVDVIGEKERQTLTQRIAQDLKGNPALKLRVKFTDSLAALEDFFVNAYGGAVRTAKGRLNPMVLISRALDASRVSKAAQEQGGLGFDSGLIVATELKNAEGQNVSYQGVMGRIAEAAKERGETYEQFRTKVDTVLYGHREYNLRETNKTLPADEQVELLLDDKQIDALEAAFQKDDFIKGVSSDLDTIRFNLLDTLVKAGRISEEQAQDYKDAIGYIPFSRIGEYENAWAKATQGANRGVAALKNIRKLEGSDRKTKSVTENFSELMDWGTKEAMKNDAALRALKDMELMGAAFKRPNKPKTDAPGDMVTVFDGGKAATYYVPDPAHVVAFSIADPQLSNVLKAFQRGSQVLRAGVTSLPPFAIKQVFDDIVRAYTYAGVKNNAALVKSVMLNFPKNWVNEIFKKKPADIKALEGLGIVGTFDFTQQGNLKNILEEAGAKKESLGSSIMRVMEAGAKASDLAVRQAIYDQVMKETGDKAQAESAAREIINFSRRGSSRFMGQMISIIPFFNAYARGMDKLATAAAGKVVGETTGTARSMFYKRMAVMTSMGLAYALMMQDDDDYQNLPDHVRDTNWVLPHGKELGFTPVIPIPAELAFFFKAIPERVVRYYKLYGTQEEQAAIDVLGELTKRGIDVFSSPNITAQVLRPFLENIANYSFFLGRPLESQAQQALRPFERYGTGTSDTMKLVAKGLENAANATGIETFAVSPIKLENAIRGVFGTAGGLVLSVTDMALNPGRTDRPLHQQLGSQLTGLSAVTKDPIGSRNLDFIYDLEKRVEQVNGTVNRLMERKPEDVEQFIKDNIGLYSIRGPVQAMMSNIRVLNQAAMAIDRDTSMKPDERRKQINQLRIDQNKLAQQAMMLRKMARDIQMGR